MSGEMKIIDMLNLNIFLPRERPPRRMNRKSHHSRLVLSILTEMGVGQATSDSSTAKTYMEKLHKLLPRNAFVLCGPIVLGPLDYYQSTEQ
jgi:hypothetical protein